MSSSQNFDNTTELRLLLLRSPHPQHFTRLTGKIMGLSGTVLNWFESYLNDRNYLSIGSYKSEQKKKSWSYRGSILETFLFNIYMLPLTQIMVNNKLSYHSCVDDMPMYMTISPGDCSPIQN